MTGMHRMNLADLLWLRRTFSFGSLGKCPLRESAPLSARRSPRRIGPTGGEDRSRSGSEGLQFCGICMTRKARRVQTHSRGALQVFVFVHVVIPKTLHTFG
ncbi:hypothetical protein SAMCCGM7_pC1709 (plasmid) [Sinorhizobium americanum CCGM7]|nr:hypothetical protein SAMCCGM7_pC1709 [Sinorhizobium americanum CCGM7]